MEKDKQPQPGQSSPPAGGAAPAASAPKEVQEPGGAAPAASAPKVQEPGGPASAASEPKVQEPLSRTQEYQKQLAKHQARYLQRAEEAWTAYRKKTGQAYNTYQDTVREIYDGGKKKAAAASQGSEESPAQDLEAFKAARAGSQRSANELHLQARSAEHKYTQVCTSFWDEVWDAVSAAATDFLDWIIGWWDEPPVEGVAPLRALADPAWRAAIDPTTVSPYYAGWNYGPSLS